MGVIEIILTALTGIFGIGWGAQFLWYRHEKRKREAETRDAEIDVDRKEDELRDKRLSDAYEMIMKTQDMVNREREARLDLVHENTQLKLQLAEKNERLLLAEFARCTRDGCTNRIPPRIADACRLHESTTLKE